MEEEVEGVRGAEESAGSVEWVEKGVMSDLLPKVPARTKRKVLVKAAILYGFLVWRWCH